MDQTREPQTALATRTETTALDIDLDLVADGLAKIRAFQSLVQKQMVRDHDFGVIPGTQKPTLLKPGAEKIAKLLGLADTYVVADKVEDWKAGFFAYTVRCRLSSIRTGDVVSEGLGHCNSRESRYAWRWCFGSEVPEDVDKRGLKTKTITTKRGPATMYRVPNDDIYSQVNTLLKMAKKRSLVDAALSAGRLSDLFTQDMEDVEFPRPVERQSPPAADGDKAAITEQIKAALVAKFPGQGEAAKARKAEELYTVFGQRTWRGVCALPTEILQKGLAVVQAVEAEVVHESEDDLPF